MTFLDLDHEHAFFAHEDPRYLICRCGQFAVRGRTPIGAPEIRLIDPPQPIFRPPTPRADVQRAEPGADEITPERDTVVA